MSGGARRRSLVSTLFVRVALLLTAALIVIGAIALQSARARIYEIYDAELSSGAMLLDTLVSEELEHADSEPGAPTLLADEDIESFNAYARWRMFRIWRGAELVARSKTGPSRLARAKITGFVDMIEDVAWRIYFLQAKEEGVTIAVGEPMAQRDGVVNGFALALGLPLLLLVPAVVGLIWLALRDGLDLLRRLESALHAKSESDLTPIGQSQWPVDFDGIVASVDGFLNRLERAFLQTRRFTDNAAHELRTPLAGLKLNAQMLETEVDPQEKRAIARRIREGAERSAALVEQLLMLARLDSGAFPITATNVSAIAKSVLEEFASTAAADDIRLALVAPPTVTVQADPVLLKLILGNLVDNAIKHSPPDSEVVVEAVTDPGAVRVKVMDKGPGIPPQERQRVFERFHRLGDDKPGVGLGLSIVAEALSRIGGTIALEDPGEGPGLWVVMRLRAG